MDGCIEDEYLRTPGLASGNVNRASTYIRTQFPRPLVYEHNSNTALSPGGDEYKTKHDCFFSERTDGPRITIVYLTLMMSRDLLFLDQK